MAQLGGLESGLAAQMATEAVTRPEVGLSGFMIVTIRKAMNGWDIQVGCKHLVFQKKEDLLKELGRYMDAPISVAKEYLDRENKEVEK